MCSSYDMTIMAEPRKTPTAAGNVKTLQLLQNSPRIDYAEIINPPNSFTSCGLITLLWSKSSPVH